MNNKKYYLASLAIFTAFAALVFNHAFYLTLEADGAFNAGVAKNWLLGYGYSSSWSGVQPFEAFISSGPGFTALQALGISLFGFSPDVQQPWIAFVHLSLWGLVLCLLHTRFTPAQFLRLVLLSSILFAVVQFKYWLRPAGEVLTFLYLMLALCCLDRATIVQVQLRYFFFAGLAAALGCLTKTQFLIVMPVLLFWSVLAISKLPNAKLKASLSLVLGFAVPTVSWALYVAFQKVQLQLLDPDYLAYAEAKSWYFFSMRGSGLLTLMQIYSGEISVLDAMARNFVLNFNKIGDALELFAFRQIAAAVFLLISLCGLLAVWCGKKRRRMKHYTLLMLCFWGWGLFVNDYIFFSHLLLGIWLLIFFLICLAVARPWVCWGVSGVLLVWLVLVHQLFLSKNPESCMQLRYGACLFTGENSWRAQRQELLDFLASNTLDAPVLTCGWLNAHELEFSLPGVANFQECSRFFEDKLEPDVLGFIEQAKLPASFSLLSSDAILSKFVHRKINPMTIKTSMPVRKIKPVEFYFVADPTFRGLSNAQEIYIESWLKFCSESVVVAGQYELKKCSDTDFNNYLAYWGGLPFPLFSWEANYFFRLQELFMMKRSLREFSMKE